MDEADLCLMDIEILTKKMNIGSLADEPMWNRQ